MLREVAEKHYDDRANKLISSHPLGIQVNLKSGVANGVLVVRDFNTCSSLLKSILLDDMNFDIETNSINEKEYIYLREKISKCIFRVQSGDILLSNAFWNLYLNNEKTVK